MSAIEVRHFGLHRHDNMAFLHQQEGGTCVTPGLEGLESPLVVRTANWQVTCPHRLGEPEAGEVIDHPFVRAMSPAQEGGLFHVYPQDVPWLWRLAKMTPGPEVPVMPLWMATKRWIPNQLRLTNLAPLCIIELAARDYALMERLARGPRLRNLIFSGPLKLPEATVLEPTGLPLDHDWPAEGRRQLYHLIRRSEP